LTEAKNRQVEAEERLTDAILAEAAAQERLNDANKKTASLGGGGGGVGVPSVFGGAESAAVANGVLTQAQADELMMRRFRPFADGGLVKNPMLGLVGEAGPELIVPLSKLGSMGSNVNITVNAGLGASGLEIGREIDQYLREYANFTGQSYSFGSIGSIF
jgi:hypothetical protein